MNIKFNRFLKGSLFFGITLFILYIGQNFWFNYSIKEPLTKELNNISGVNKVDFQQRTKFQEPLNIDINLSKVSNFHKTYTKIDETIKHFMGQRQYELSIIDNRTDELEQLYYDIHYYIEEAIFNGDFPMLSIKTSEIANTVDAKSQIYIDSKNIFVHLHKNENSLYMLISRH